MNITDFCESLCFSATNVFDNLNAVIRSLFQREKANDLWREEEREWFDSISQPPTRSGVFRLRTMIKKDVGKQIVCGVFFRHHKSLRYFLGIDFVQFVHLFRATRLLLERSVRDQDFPFTSGTFELFRKICHLGSLLFLPIIWQTSNSKFRLYNSRFCGFAIFSSFAFLPPHPHEFRKLWLANLPVEAREPTTTKRYTALQELYTVIWTIFYFGEILTKIFGRSVSKLKILQHYQSSRGNARVWKRYTALHRLTRALHCD